MVNKDTADAKTLQEKITAMREGGKILGNLLRDLKNYVQPGMTGKEIDAWVRKEIVRRGAGVAYDMLEEEFPGALCISINEQLVHGAPTDEVLEEGDKVYFGRHFRNGSDEPMVWDVLKVDGQKALLTSKEILTITIFHDSPDNWAHCNTRRWLNKDFLTEAFNVEEVLTIKETEQPEKGTTDRVFLLDDETAAMWVVWDE